MHEQSRHLQFGQMRCAELVRLIRRMERIREQEQTCTRLGLGGGEHAGLTPAIGMAAEKNRSWAARPQRGGRGAQRRTILGRGFGQGRSKRAALAEREVAAKHTISCSAEGFSESDEQRRAAIATGSMREDEFVSDGASRLVEEAANGAFRERDNRGAPHFKKIMAQVPSGSARWRDILPR